MCYIENLEREKSPYEFCALDDSGNRRKNHEMVNEYHVHALYPLLQEETEFYGRMDIIVQRLIFLSLLYLW